MKRTVLTQYFEFSNCVLKLNDALMGSKVDVHLDHLFSAQQDSGLNGSLTIAISMANMIEDTSRAINARSSAVSMIREAIERSSFSAISFAFWPKVLSCRVSLKWVFEIERVEQTLRDHRDGHHSCHDHHFPRSRRAEGASH